MNASMNDSHNLGTRLSHVTKTLFLTFILSLEVDTCTERLGKTSIAENRESS